MSTTSPTGTGAATAAVADPAVALTDQADARRAHAAPGLLRAFNDQAVLTSADIHVARCLAGLGAEEDETVVLAAALAVRAPRLGHVCTDLATARQTTITDAEAPAEVQALPWPEPDGWVRRVAASPLVAGSGPGAPRPLHLDGSRLYLDRYWRQERQVAADLRDRSGPAVAGVDGAVLAAGLRDLFGTDGPQPDLQRLASAAAVLRPVSVIAGGPGTGKTTIVARVLALLAAQAAAAGQDPPRVALAAPTGKAAGRLEEAVHAAAAGLAVDGATRAWLAGLSASTLHRLLGWRPGSHSRFRHDRSNRLPHDVVIVDETSMVSLSLMAKLVDALRTDARLVLVGDPEQLASVEAGAVLGDVVGPAAHGLRIRPPARAALGAATGQPVPATDPPPGTTIGDGIVVLRRVHRYGGGIAALAAAIQAGADDEVMDLLREERPDVEWIDADVADQDAEAALGPVRRAVVGAGRRLTGAARDGDLRGALDALAALRVLCAHREGPHGVGTWTAQIERWLAAGVEDYPGAGGRWYLGRPLLVTENDYELQLYNGDTGVIAAVAGGRTAAVFERRGGLVEVSPTRLGAVETVHAMTVHKSQGSQFAAVALLLPDAASPILTRQLLYTAVTRARQRVMLVGPEASVRAAVTRPIARASGLGDRLWT